MSIYEKDLVAAVAREMGDTDPSNYTYTSNQIFSAINDGYAELNRRGHKVIFSVSGTGDMAYFSNPSIDEQRAIVLCAALVLTEGEIQKSARNSIMHQNVAGRTDLTQIVQWLLQIRDRLSAEIDGWIDNQFYTTDNSNIDGDALTEGYELRNRGALGSELRNTPYTGYQDVN